MNAKIIVCCLFVILSTTAWTQKSSVKPPWEPLFNGKNFNGWQIIGSKGKAWVEDGAIVCHQVSNTPEHIFISTKNPEKYKKPMNYPVINLKD